MTMLNLYVSSTLCDFPVVALYGTMYISLICTDRLVLVPILRHQSKNDWDKIFLWCDCMHAYSETSPTHSYTIRVCSGSLAGGGHTIVVNLIHKVSKAVGYF